MNTNPDPPLLSRAPRLPLVWIVPLVAAAVGGWMVFNELRNRGPLITIDFVDGSGVEAGKTVLEHKGVAVGLVTAVALKPDHSGVSVRLRLNRSAASLAVAGTQFWLVQPEIGLSGVRGLDTLLTGARLNLRRGSGAPTTHFTGVEKIPPPELPTQGRAFILQSDRLGSLNTGAPVYYREFKVGAVETTRLADDATTVLIRIHIEAPYVDLIRTDTRFWNAGGFSFKVGLLGAEMKNTSLESLLAGGVSFATPETGAPSAEEGRLFVLTNEPAKEWLTWSPKIPINSPENAAPASTVAAAH